MPRQNFLFSGKRTRTWQKRRLFFHTPFRQTRWLKADWFQIDGFVEGGRVADEYDFSELFSDWKVDGGIGIRSMMAGTVVRFDMAVSEEGGAAWVMFAHHF